MEKIKLGDRIKLYRKEEEDILSTDSWIRCCSSKRNNYETILCWKPGEVCEVIKINKTNDNIYLKNTSRENIKFKLDKKYFLEKIYNFRKEN